MLVPIILSGGAGTRLWPVSRETHPKPFIRLSDGKSLLQKTLMRLVGMESVPEILTVTNREYYFKTKDEYELIQEELAPMYFLLEPASRNTAPAISMAAWYVMEKYGLDAVLLVLPADHLIDDQEAFHAAVQSATSLAQEGHLVTFGMTPTAPETGFGYIQLDNARKEQGAYHVKQFVEKPDLPTAQDYLASGEYLWNSGMFCFQAKTILHALEKYTRPIFEATHRCWEKSKQRKSLADVVQIDPDLFTAIRDQSIDYAVMEKASDVVVVPCHFGWNDIGSWNALSELIPSDEAGNQQVGESLLIDVKNSFIQTENRLAAAVGVENLLIIDTSDALLVADRNRAQDVKKIVALLKEKNHQCYKTHCTVFRPWGSFTTLEEGNGFKIKRIVVKPGAALSLQLHHQRSEHWVVVSGVAKVTNASHVFDLNKNESTFIPLGAKHRLENIGLEELILIEVQTGEYLGEDDIIRFEDRYQREVEFS